MPIAQQQLQDITTDIWSVMLGLALTPRLAVVTGERSGEVLTGSVQITGAWEGAVLVDLPVALARRACALLLGVDEQECSPDDIHDTVGELANMTGGNVKGLLGPAAELSLPSVTAGRDYRITVPGTRLIAQAAFSCESLPLQVTVLEAVAAGASPIGTALAEHAS